MSTHEQTPKGSTWYAWGEHHTIADHADVNGEPGVVLRKTGSKKRQVPISARLLVKHGVRTDTEE